MDCLGSPFTIEVDGTPIAKVAESLEDRVEAVSGPDAALFTLKDGYLLSGDYVLGRCTIENRSFGPKPVFWFKNGSGESRVQPVRAHESGGSYELGFAGAGLIVADGKILADLTGSRESEVVLKFLAD